MESVTLLKDVVVLFAVGAVAVIAFDRARLPPLLGYLLTGVVIGPYGLGLISAMTEVQALAEIGVVLLLFTIGLEFSVDHFVALRRTVLVGGGLQIGLTILLVAMIAIALGDSWPQGVFLGMLAAHSSSTLIIRLQSDRGELDALHTRSALGISLLQDVSIVPMVLVVPLLAGEATSAAEVLWTIGKAVLFIAAAFLAIRKVVPPLLKWIVGSGRREAFLLAVIALCFGAAWSAAAAGLSIAIGAFIAGLVVSESEYSHHALDEILPLREIFVSLFFVSMGMLLDARILLAAAGPVIAILAGVVLLKLVVSTAGMLIAGHSGRTSVRAGIALAQVGEFAFVLSLAGAEAGLLDGERMQWFLTAAIGSMIAMPILMLAAPRLTRLLLRVFPLRVDDSDPEGGMPLDRRAELVDHTIIIGYGMNGRNLARVLAENGIPHVVIEVNPEIVREERRRGRRMVFGDATRPQVLEAAGIRRARVVVVAISDAAATRTAVHLARRAAPSVHIVVRSRYIGENEVLLALGANEVIAEEFETSIEIFSRVLQRYLLPRDVIDRAITGVREDAYETLRKSVEEAGPAVTTPGG